MSVTSLGGQLARRLADDLQRMNERENQHLVAIGPPRAATKRPTERSSRLRRLLSER